MRRRFARVFVETLTGQRHDRVQTESRIATVDSCFDLVGSLQHGVASCEVFSWSTDIHKTHYMQMVTSDETQVQIFANWPMSHAKLVTRDNRKNPENRVVAAIRKLRTDTNCPAGKSWPNHVKNEQQIGSAKTYGPQNTEQLKIMIQRTACQRYFRARNMFLGNMLRARKYRFALSFRVLSNKYVEISAYANVFKFNRENKRFE